VNGQLRNDDGNQSRCPRHFQTQERVQQAVNISPRFSDPYLAHIHQFLNKKPSSGYYHNWKVDPGKSFNRWHGGQHHNWTHPPINPEQFKQKKSSELVKLVDNHDVY